MKKRILSMLLAMLLVFSFMPLSNAASVDVDKTEADDAKAFVESITGYYLADKTITNADTWIKGATTYGATDKNVTRAEFVGAMAVLFKLNLTTETDYFFADVPPSHVNASAIRQACELGWVSKAEAFRPTNSITYAEAVKIAVTAMGYEDIAMANGGYTTGYFKVAKDIGLLNGLSMEEDLEFSKDELAIFMANMLNGKIARVISAGVITKYDTEITLMEYYYDIYKVKGIIDATKHSSLTSETAQFPRDMISINGEHFYYDGYSDDLLGYNVNAYCRYDEETGVNKVVYLKFTGNEVFEYNASDFGGYSNGKMQFEDEYATFSEKHKIEGTYTFVYNGKKLVDKANTANYIKNANGKVRLVDNDSDGAVEVIFLEDYKYIYVSEINAEKEIISDFNKASNNLKLEDVDYVIYDNETGAEVGFENIKIGSVVAVAKSKDSKVAKLLICDEEVSGTPESYGSEGVVFDGVEYEVSSYYKTYYTTAYGKYEPGVYYIGINNDLVAYSAVTTNMTYGYGVQVASDVGFDTVVKIKVLNDYGKVKIYEIADRVMVDGEWKDADKSGVTNLVNTLFKYALVDGKIKYIDTPKEMTLESMFEESSYDSMTYTGLTAVSTGRYRSTGNAFEGAYYVNKSVIFVIDENDVEYGSKVGNYNYLESNESYKDLVTFYDVDGAGFAGAVVTTKNFGSALGSSSSNGSVIISVSSAFDSEGEECYKVKLMTYQGYLKTYYMAYDLMPKKTSGKMLGMGDIVKTLTDTKDERILGIEVMFDGEKMAVEATDKFKDTSFANNNFRYGMVYNYNNNNIAYSNTTSFDGSYVFDLSTLKYQSVNTTNIVTIDRDAKVVRKGYQDDFKSYRDYEDLASRVVVMCNYSGCSGVFIYEN